MSLFIYAALAVLAAHAHTVTGARPILPVLPLNITALQISAHSSNSSSLFTPLLFLAYSSLSSPLHSVTSPPPPPFLPPNGNARLFLSLDPFWWPEPPCNVSSPSHPLTCRYHTREGVVNERDVSSVPGPSALSALTLDALALSLGAALSGDARLAARAGAQLQTFFLDPALSMLPTLVYAQVRVGNNSRPISARPEGLLELRELSLLLQTEAMLAAWHNDSVWSSAQHVRFTAWMEELLSFLTSSVQALTAALSPTRLSTWWYCQRIALHWHLGQPAQANASVQAYLSTHYDRQFNASARTALGGRRDRVVDERRAQRRGARLHSRLRAAARRGRVPRA